MEKIEIDSSKIKETKKEKASKLDCGALVRELSFKNRTETEHTLKYIRYKFEDPDLYKYLKEKEIKEGLLSNFYINPEKPDSILITFDHVTDTGNKRTANKNYFFKKFVTVPIESEIQEIIKKTFVDTDTEIKNVQVNFGDEDDQIIINFFLDKKQIIKSKELTY